MNEKSTIQFVISGVFVFAMLLPGIAFLVEHKDAYAAENPLSQFVENIGQSGKSTLSFVSEVARSGAQQGVKQLQESRRRIFVLFEKSRVHLRNTFGELYVGAFMRAQPDSKGNFFLRANVFEAIGEMFNNLSIGLYKGVNEIFSSFFSSEESYIQNKAPIVQEPVSPAPVAEEKADESAAQKSDSFQETAEQSPTVVYVQAPPKTQPPQTVTTIIKEVPAPDSVSKSELESRLSALAATLLSKISSAQNTAVQYFYPSVPQPVQLLNKIDNLSGVTITSSSIIGGTWSDVDITSGSGGFGTLSSDTFSSGAVTVSGSLTLSTTTSGCLEATSSGVVWITGTACGTGSGGGSSFGQAFEITTNIFSQASLKATSTAVHNLVIDGTGTSTFSGGLEVWRQIAAPYFQATSTTIASQFPYASTTALTISGTAYISSLTGPLQALSGTVSATTTLSAAYGGTGLSTLPSYGQILLGNASSGYTLNATSSLGFIGADYRDWNLTTNIFNQSVLAPTTTQNILVSGTGTSTFAGSIEAWRQIAAPYFHATSSTATSTFAGGLTVDGSTFVVDYSSGNVGIGTATTTALFTVYGTNPIAHIRSSSLNDNANSPAIELTESTGTEDYGFQIKYLAQSNRFEINTDSSGSNGFGQNAVSIMRETHNFGLGSTSPYAKFSVAGKDTTTTLIGADAVSGFSGNLLELKLASTTVFMVEGDGDVQFLDAKGIYFNSAANDANWGIGRNIVEDTGGFLTSNNLQLKIYGNSTPQTQGLQVVNHNNVVLMEISGSDGKTVFNGSGNIGIGTTSPYAVLSIHATSTSNYENTLFAIASSTASFATTTHFVVTAGGNVGISTTSPYAKLSVIGQTVAAYFTATTTSDNTFPNLLSTNSTTTNATTTTASFTTASTTNLIVSSAGGSAGCAQFSITGLISNSGSACGTGGGLSSYDAWTHPIVGQSATTSSIVAAGFFTNSNSNFNASVGIASSTPWAKLSVGTHNLAIATPSFVIASSSTGVATTTQFIVKNGQVGIGATAPNTEKLYAFDNTDSTFGVISARTESTNSDNIAINATVAGAGTNNIALYGWASDAVTNNWGLYIESGNAHIEGLLEIATFAASDDNSRWVCIDASGASTLQAGVNASSGDCDTSSARFKHNIETLEVSALSLVSGWRPVSFIYNEDLEETIMWGFIAEEMASSSPQLAFYDSLGRPRGLQKNAILSVLAKAIQELNLNLDNIASTTATSTPESQSFATSFFNNLFKRFTTWFADAANGIGDVFARSFRAKEEICVDDQCLTKEDVRSLLTLANGSTAFVGGGNIGDEGGNVSGDISGNGGNQEQEASDTTPPIILIQGNNPAEIAINTSYADLGALITDDQDENPTTYTYLNGATTTSISIDTSVAGTHTVTYTATDDAGNTTTVERIVNIMEVQKTDDTSPNNNATTTQETATSTENVI
ncbi:MAG: DUF5011 domain-containing protein [Patescibacteria group bacterium]|nr:DUF5011 domain-containing protein [bacterium]MDZ4240548.1 DUF5011 domain-containing protein [Patescibacteria group bacterium]